MIQKVDTEDQRTPVLTQVHWPEYCKILLSIYSLCEHENVSVCILLHAYKMCFCVSHLVIVKLRQSVHALLSHSLQFLALTHGEQTVSRKTVTVCKPQLLSSFKG